ncbi:MAG: rRNA (cytidine1402-2-O)-methyltransferase [Thermosipho sp. (in: thermotogales)]|nr:rRNA (cytidine1402-2-O)-methyltransferase [Thermosipho sp. (in: thermotogales)]MDN5324403.1 rRNA (cytidine1402-2-O)-methyltransferase [Thermosipho sp. (in: thermotogales)]
MQGKLILIGTPIGNIEDISLRALKVLKEVDLILSEDTRRTLKLLNYYSISKPIDSFNEHSSMKKKEKILERLKNGEKIAYVSDAGMPVISDPGTDLVNMCHENDIEVDIIPGPSAVLTALAASGYYGNRFLFLGFMPRDKKRRRLLRKIKEGIELTDIFIFFESPERLIKTLKDILNIVGDIEIFVARELTKKFQEFFKGFVSEAIEYFENGVKGEITVILNTSKIRDEKIKKND